jgi:hypothetical protein
MFDIDGPGSVFTAVSPPADVAASPAEPPVVPLERLEAQICELAGHLAAATCRFLVLLADFDARRGWASWEMNSCAQWLSWKCQLSSGTAREHVRVARALADLPVIRAQFAAAALSYAKVRALTRIATPATEAGLAELAGPMTANQLERFARAHRQVTAADDAEARVRRRLTWRFEEDGSLSGTFRLPPLPGAVLLKALRAACAEQAGRAAGPPAGVSAETPAPETPAAPDAPAASAPVVPTSSDLADGLVAVAESFPCPNPTAASTPPTTRRSPRTRSSPPGTASGWTWTTPSPSASPTPAPTRRSGPTGSRLRRTCSGRSHGATTRRPGATSRSTNPKTATNATASTWNAPRGIPVPP